MGAAGISGSMKQFFTTMAAVFVALLLFAGLPFLFFTGWLVSTVTSPRASGPSGPVVIELDLRQGLTDQAPQNPFALFSGGGLSVMSVVEVLDRAQDDDNVRGLFIRLPESGMSPAGADEIRQAISRFRRAGKPVIAQYRYEASERIVYYRESEMPAWWPASPNATAPWPRAPSSPTDASMMQASKNSIST